MSRLLRNIRLIPIVLFAAIGLFVLKLTGILVDGGYTLGAGHLAKSDRAARDMPATVITRPVEVEPARPKLSWAQEMFGYPDVTGSVGGAKPKDGADKTAAKDNADKSAPEEAKPAEPKKVMKPASKAVPSGIPVQLEPKQLSPAERALLERLGERRQELDQRQAELDMRDTLLKAAERRLEERLNELKEAEARIVAATQKKEEAETQRLKSLVSMYENMKAKDAAKIFDRLEIRLATEVADLINPRRMSDIMAQMSPEAAERLTVALANKNAGETKPDRAKPADLPKIEGRPRGS